MVETKRSKVFGVNSYFYRRCRGKTDRGPFCPPSSLELKLVLRNFNNKIFEKKTLKNSLFLISFWPNMTKNRFSPKNSLHQFLKNMNSSHLKKIRKIQQVLRKAVSREAHRQTCTQTDRQAGRHVNNTCL